MVKETMKRVLLVLSTGYIFVYFSEHLFWARARPEDTLGEWFGAWIAYSLMAFAFLTMVTYFRIKNLWALFLAGAVFGWMAEGVVVQTTYQMLPLSISFTGLAWHALFTIWTGWYAVQSTLHASASFRTLRLAAVIGLYSGLWAITWWVEPDGGVSSLAEYATFSFVTTLLVILAYWLANWSASASFAPNRWGTILLCGAFIVYFLFITVPAAPLAIVVLPVLLGLAYLGLRRNRQRETEGSLLDHFTGRVSIWRFAGLLALPATNVAFYALALTLDLRWHTNWILYLITTPLGFILFGIGLFQAVRRRHSLEGRI